MEPYMHDLYRRSGSPIYIGGAPSAAPYTTPSLTANLVCRVLFGLIANLICAVPLRLLYRNGEFAAVVFIANVLAENARNMLNALIWRDDDTASWWAGYGLCDVDAYVSNINTGLYATCLLAIMRNLAIQVGSLRANPLTQREKRRRNIVQALIMFPLPIVQMALVYPLADQRYWIGTLVGCSWSPYPSWPYVVFFILAPVVVALVTAAYAILIYIRYREIAKTTASALSSNPVASMRSQRTKRRLYLMVLSILTPFLPVTIGLAIANILLMGPLQPFNFHTIHHSGGSGSTMPWDSILFLPSEQINVIYLNNCYIPIVTVVPIFLFFGMTRDAMNCYRKMLLFAGFGRLFPCLLEEYDPDRSALSNTNGSSAATTTCMPSTGARSKTSTFVASKQLSSYASSSTVSSSTQRPEPMPMPLHFLTSADPDVPATEIQQPAPATTRPAPAVHTYDSPLQPPLSNPFMFRTRLNFSVPFSFSLFKSSAARGLPPPVSSISLQPLNSRQWDVLESPPPHPQPQTATFSTWSNQPRPSSRPSISKHSQTQEYISPTFSSNTLFSGISIDTPSFSTTTSTSTSTSSSPSPSLLLFLLFTHMDINYNTTTTHKETQAFHDFFFHL
ncbi:hypothetical protein PT974_08349 [Cladobotryum mycophilum]|uniref:Pheromone a factor receptor n=1 Tax=Cladobotryum mycophilum TaxID=491253 RepID=A0ABR0SD42_9HYPO